MLIVDVNALRTVNGLYLFKDIILNALDTLNTQDILRPYATAVEHLTRNNLVTSSNLHVGIERQYVFLQKLLGFGVQDTDMVLTVAVVKLYDAFDFAKSCTTLRFTNFEQFLDLA